MIGQNLIIDPEQHHEKSFIPGTDADFLTFYADLTHFAQDICVEALTLEELRSENIAEADKAPEVPPAESDETVEAIAEEATADAGALGEAEPEETEDKPLEEAWLKSDDESDGQKKPSYRGLKNK